MVDMNTLFDLQITIFCLMLAGYLLTKLNVLTLDARKPLSRSSDQFYSSVQYHRLFYDRSQPLDFKRLHRHISGVNLHSDFLSCCRTFSLSRCTKRKIIRSAIRNARFKCRFYGESNRPGSVRHAGTFICIRLPDPAANCNVVSRRHLFYRKQREKCY